jgi:Flp pilus assembly protein TadB
MSCGPWYTSRPRAFAADPGIRIGDAERNQVTDTLSQHFSEGRLDATELKERLDRAMGAKTRGDLVGLTADLPPLPRPPAPPPSHLGRVAMWVALFLILAAFVVPWHYAGWPWVMHVPWLLVAVGVCLFVSSRRRRRRRAAIGA